MQAGIGTSFAPKFLSQIVHEKLLESRWDEKIRQFICRMSPFLKILVIFGRISYVLGLCPSKYFYERKS